MPSHTQRRGEKERERELEFSPSFMVQIVFHSDFSNRTKAEKYLSSRTEPNVDDGSGNSSTLGWTGDGDGGDGAKGKNWNEKEQ